MNTEPLSHYDELLADRYLSFASADERHAFHPDTPLAVRGALLLMGSMPGRVRVWQGDPVTGRIDDPLAPRGSISPLRYGRVTLGGGRVYLYRLHAGAGNFPLPTEDVLRIDYAPDEAALDTPGLTVYLHPKFHTGLDEALIVGRPDGSANVELPLSGDDCARRVLATFENFTTAVEWLAWVEGDRFDL